MRLRGAASFACACAFACGDRAPAELPHEGQLLVYLTTDAPLPAEPGVELGADDPAPLFDRARFEIFPPGARAPCAGCFREFELDRKLVSTARASVGVVPKPQTPGYVVRVRIFKSAFIEAGEPRADATVDVTAALPPIPSEGVTEVTVKLRTEDVARRVGTLDAPVAVDAGRPIEGFVGSWAPAQRRGCAREPDEGTACVPGGAFWLGNPIRRALADPGDDASTSRLVTLEPFFLDAAEVTVSRFRATKSAIPRDPLRYHFDDGAPGPRLHCTYTDALGNQEALPINCLSWERARAHCQARGGDLPTEAQLTYAAGALESRSYPWGDDTPTCGDAIYGRMPGVVPEYSCPGQWVQPAGGGRRDRVALPSGTLLDLAGNVAEYARDHWSLHIDRCAGPGILRDPLCDRPTEKLHVMIGGCFVDGAAGLATGTRRPSFDFAKTAAQGPGGGVDAPRMTSVGFRCAFPNAP